MKRYSLGLVILAMVLVLGTTVCAKFPTSPDSTATFNVQQGFGPTGQTIWFFCTDTNDINFASTRQFPYRQMTLAPPLQSLCSGIPTVIPPVAVVGAAPVFINTGFQQGPIFSAVPATPLYSGFWTVVFINWLPGQARRVCNLLPFNAVTNPNGFPITIPGPTQQATLSLTYGTTRSCAVLDCPIVAVGNFPLSGPWFGVGMNANPLVLYRLPQVIAFNGYYKTVTLPAYYTYCQENISKYIDKCTVIIPDVEDPILAARLKANLAPGMATLDPGNAQDFDFIDGRIFGAVPPISFILGGPVGPLQTVNQYPIIAQCPTGVGAMQSNRLYTPFMHFDVLEANPANPIICFVNNDAFAEMLVLSGVFIEVPDLFINAPVLSCAKILPPSGSCCFPP